MTLTERRQWHICLTTTLHSACTYGGELYSAARNSDLRIKFTFHVPLQCLSYQASHTSLRLSSDAGPTEQTSGPQGRHSVVLSRRCAMVRGINTILTCRSHDEPASYLICGTWPLAHFQRHRHLIVLQLRLAGRGRSHGLPFIAFCVRADSPQS